MSASKHAFVTGITGQDGSYLTELLTSQGYRVTGLVRPSALVKSSKDVVIERWDMRDAQTISRLLARDQPDEFYNLAAHSSGAGMFDDPVSTGDVNGLGITRILDAIKSVSPSTRLCQASSAEIFGAASSSPQSEMSCPDPRTPYGAAKLYAQTMIRIYRQHFGLFACSAILFNHESSRRAATFVTRKVTKAAAAISRGLTDHVVLGNLSARRDWGFAGDYVRAMWLMLQQERADDYVIATGVTHSVEHLCQVAFDWVGLDYHKFVRVVPQPFRARETLQLVGDAHKAALELGWAATVTFDQMIGQMIDADLAALDDKKGRNSG